MQQMPETYYRTGSHKVDHTTFGGIICASDYNTSIRKALNTKGSPIASRIISDRNFDNLCRRNIELKMRKGDQ